MIGGSPCQNFSFTNEKAECLAKSMYKGQTRSYCSNSKGELHKYTRNELEKLQTVPVNYTEGVSFTQACMMLGNGWTVDVVSHILKKTLFSLGVPLMAQRIVEENYSSYKAA